MKDILVDVKTMVDGVEIGHVGPVSLRKSYDSFESFCNDSSLIYSTAIPEVKDLIGIAETSSTDYVIKSKDSLILGEAYFVYDVQVMHPFISTVETIITECKSFD